MKARRVRGPQCNDFFHSRLSPGLPQICCTSPLRISMALNPSLFHGVWPLKPEPQYLAPTCCSGHARFLAMIPVVDSLHFDFQASVFPSEVPKPHPLSPLMKVFRVWANFSSLTIPFPGHRSLSWQPLSVSFFNLCLLPYFILSILDCHFGSLVSSASIQKVFCRHFPNAEVFLMYLWGGMWSPLLTPPPSWRSPQVFTFKERGLIRK